MCIRDSLKESGFEGNPVVISFTYDAEGLEPGYVENGTFTVVCNGGEYELSFTAVIERPYLMTSHGKVQNLSLIHIWPGRFFCFFTRHCF